MLLLLLQEQQADPCTVGCRVMSHYLQVYVHYNWEAWRVQELVVEGPPRKTPQEKQMKRYLVVQQQLLAMLAAVLCTSRQIADV